MFTSRKRTAWAGVGLLLSLTISSPVWADDVELLLSTPGLGGAARPNLLFILDSSGSMTGEVSTQTPYDPRSFTPATATPTCTTGKTGPAAGFQPVAAVTSSRKRDLTVPRAPRKLRRPVDLPTPWRCTAITKAARRRGIRSTAGKTTNLSSAGKTRACMAPTAATPRASPTRVAEPTRAANIRAKLAGK